MDKSSPLTTIPTTGVLEDFGFVFNLRRNSTAPSFGSEQLIIMAEKQSTQQW